MTFATDFIPLALRTESDVAPLTVNRALFRTVLNIAIQASELADQIKKHAAYNRPIDIAKFRRAAESTIESARTLEFVVEGSFKMDADDQPSTIDTRIFHGIFGLFTESGELMEALLKAYDTGSFDVVNLKEEIGDQEWYQAILVDALGANMEAIQARVIEKLRARYPQKYTDESAINRDLTTERAILERDE